MKIILHALLWPILLSSCQSKTNEVKHIFYLHGRIIEIQGPDAISEKFGQYEYNAIIDSLKNTGVIIHNEVRTEQTDFQDFCKRTADEITRLVESGVKPSNISLIGASKGAVMAMNISSMNPHPINYILLAANNEHIERDYQWNLHGRILGIYEKSDLIADKNYDHWINKSTQATEFKQLEINTGLGHGFLYRPISEWMEPAKEWMEN